MIHGTSNSEENFGRNQLLDGLINLLPLYPNLTVDLHVKITMSNLAIICILLYLRFASKPCRSFRFRIWNTHENSFINRIHGKNQIIPSNINEYKARLSQIKILCTLFITKAKCKIYSSYTPQNYCKSSDKNRKKIWILYTPLRNIIKL